MLVKDWEDIAERLMRVLGEIDLKIAMETGVESYLNARDENPFDADWSAASRMVEAMKSRLDDESLQKLDALNEKLREKIWKHVFNEIGGDAAGYLSDDFGLMLDALSLVDLEESWVFGLHECYASRRLPAGRIPARPRPCWQQVVDPGGKRHGR